MSLLGAFHLDTEALKCHLASVDVIVQPAIKAARMHGKDAPVECCLSALSTVFRHLILPSSAWHMMEQLNAFWSAIERLQTASPSPSRLQALLRFSIAFHRTTYSAITRSPVSQEDLEMECSASVRLDLFENLCFLKVNVLRDFCKARVTYAARCRVTHLQERSEKGTSNHNDNQLRALGHLGLILHTIINSSYAPVKINKAEIRGTNTALDMRPHIKIEKSTKPEVSRTIRRTNHGGPGFRSVQLQEYPGTSSYEYSGLAPVSSLRASTERPSQTTCPICMKSANDLSTLAFHLQLMHMGTSDVTMTCKDCGFSVAILGKDGAAHTGITLMRRHRRRECRGLIYSDHDLKHGAFVGPDDLAESMIIAAGLPVCDQVQCVKTEPLEEEISTKSGVGIVSRPLPLKDEVPDE